MFEKLNLFHTELTEAQLVSLFEVMNQGTKIKQIDIESHTSLQNVHPQLFASVVNNLECANLGFTSLSQQHFENLFLLMKSRTNLNILNIRGEKSVSSVVNRIWDSVFTFIASKALVAKRPVTVLYRS